MNLCKNCAYLMTDEGEYYYCSLLPLYTEAEPSDEACEDYVGVL